MPIIESAKKKLRQDRKRTKQNVSIKNALKDGIKDAKKSRSKKNLASAFAKIDTAVKKHVIHKNKAARLKSQISKTNGKS